MSKIAWLLIFPVTMWAQGDRGIIAGTVSDSIGAVIAGAKVTAMSLAVLNAKASLSPAHFQRTFQAVFGETSKTTWRGSGWIAPRSGC